MTCMTSPSLSEKQVDPTGRRSAIAPRASTILFDLLASKPERVPFLLPANICPIVPLTFLKAGVAFEFVDISPVTLCLDLEQTAERLERGHYGGIVYAHTYGDPSTPREFFSEVKHLHEDVLVIDDRCLCTPNLEVDASNPADILLFSTGPTKTVDLGYGGYAFLGADIAYQPHPQPFHPKDLDALEQAYKGSLKNCRPFLYCDSAWLQTEGPPTEKEAYFGEIRKARPVFLAHRRAINAVYVSRLPEEIQLPEPYQMWRFNLLVKDKATLLKALFGAGLFASSHYASLAGIFTPGSCQQAESLASQVINLFNDQHYTQEMAERTCDIIEGSL